MSLDFSFSPIVLDADGTWLFSIVSDWLIAGLFSWTSGDDSVLVVRATVDHESATPVAVNDPFLDLDHAAHLFKYDSIHGKACCIKCLTC